MTADSQPTSVPQVTADPGVQPEQGPQPVAMQCAREDTHGGHTWGGVFGKRWCDGFIGRAGVPQPPTRRLRDCVEAWPDAETGAYDPRCCRWPKSCSATIYDEGTVANEDLEPAPPVKRIVICTFGGMPHPINDECQGVRDAEPTAWVSSADCAHASMHVHGADGRCQNEPQPNEPVATPPKVGDTIPRSATSIPPNVVQFVDQRYLRVWSKRPANPASTWGSAKPSVAWSESTLLGECAPLTVTAVSDGHISSAGHRAAVVALSDYETEPHGELRLNANRAAAKALMAAAPHLSPQPGWLFVGDHSPAFLAAVAAYLEAHEDLDVQDIGARIRAAGGA